MATVKDFYAILDVEPSADNKTIRSAYRLLARQWHPDANLDNVYEAEERFKALAEAYEILGNPELRMKYDVVRPKLRRGPQTPKAPVRKPVYRPNSTPSWQQPSPPPSQSPTLTPQQSNYYQDTTVPSPSNLERRQSDPTLQKAYSIFEASFDRMDERSATFSGFFDIFMNVKPESK